MKNDHLRFDIRYRKDGVPHDYRPDFIAKLANGLHLILEVKGQIGDAEIKKAAAGRWVNAVNRDGRFGRWAYAIEFHPADVMKRIDQLSKAGAEATA